MIKGDVEQKFYEYNIGLDVQTLNLYTTIDVQVGNGVR